MCVNVSKSRYLTDVSEYKHEEKLCGKLLVEAIKVSEENKNKVIFKIKSDYLIFRR